MFKRLLLQWLSVTPKVPIPTSKPVGTCPDDMDRFHMNDGFEDPKRWEETIHEAFADAERDQVFADILRVNYLEKDLAASFLLFQQSPIPKAIEGLLQRLNVTHQSAIADVGCGRAHLAYSLHKLGYANLTAMDPNGEWYTGTGYLKSLTDHNIKIVNDLAEWSKIFGYYDAIVSSGTVHHWQHVPRVAIDVRRVMKPGAYWLMISEYIANTSLEFLYRLNSHPTATRYNSYEWAYPASVYVDLVQTSGFNLVGVIPKDYNHNEFFRYSDHTNAELSQWVDQNLCAPNGTVEAFWSEVDRFRRNDSGSRSYTEPQVLIFQRVEPD
jgi:2-polyprenyl-3-methyl-5-hydroxy-6-metoxy-1,4-benzoquinol methylase